jgi:lipopolysaccharide transport system ATP-binding protein
MRPAIRVDNLSKRYRVNLNQDGARYRTLREDLMACGSRLTGWLRGRRRPAGANEFWALRDVDLTIDPGEVVGIIGRNGAGKSTLLKIISRITRPTAGRVTVRGHFGSLLEVGTGFHPELTGRENIFLNGAILGMRRHAIRKKFDEIVAFSGVERFLDTPVKRFSSGMYVRLAFAVAAHLEPDILVVDEVLAVGDLSFQQKCLGKMGEVSRAGRTVLLVSHQMNAVRRLCRTCVWLDGGRVRMTGPAARVVNSYEADVDRRDAGPAADRGAAGDRGARFVGWQVVGPTGEAGHTVRDFEPVALEFLVRVTKPLPEARTGVAIFDGDGQVIWSSHAQGLSFEEGAYRLSYRLPSLPIKPGRYRVQVSLLDQEGFLDLWDCTPLLEVATDFVTHPIDQWGGVLNLPSEFALVPCPEGAPAHAAGEAR